MRDRARGVAAVAALVVMALTTPAVADERVDVTAIDGVQLIGELGGSSGPGIVLVHGARADRRRWAAVATVLVGRGFRTLRLDLRGHGESGGAVDLATADRDVEGAYRYLLGRKIRPVFLVGDGVGGSAALVVATRVPVGGVAVVGRRPADQDPDPRSALALLRAPLLFVVDEANPDTKALASTAPTARVVVVPEADVVGSPRTVPALLDFLGAAR